MQEYYIYKLKNLDLQDRLKRFPPDFKFNTDFAYLIMYFVIEQMANRIEKSKFSDIYEAYNSLDSKILQSYIHDYRNHIRYLGENFPNIGNIFERRPYDKGRCYSYRFRPYYRDKQLEPYLITDKYLIKKLRNKNQLTISYEVQKNCSFLLDYFDVKRLTIQFQEALDLNADKLEEEGNVKKYLSNALKILKIKNGNYYMSHNPESDGRFHSNITGFPKDFREFLRYDGEKMVEIDISASVPTFLYYNLINYQSTTKHIESIINKKSYYIHYMLVKDVAIPDNKEIQEFGAKILGGELYASFTPRLEEFYGTLDDTYRQWQWNEFFFPENSFKNYLKKPRPKKPSLKESKNAMLSMFNAKSGLFDLEELSFKCQYPTIFEFLKSFKKPNHKYFSQLTLQTESYFMLNIIARRLSNKFRKKIPFFTLHDCIVTTESNLNNVFEFMRTTFEAELGFLPVLNDKVWE